MDAIARYCGGCGQRVRLGACYCTDCGWRVVPVVTLEPSGRLTVWYSAFEESKRGLTMVLPRRHHGADDAIR